MTEPSVGVRDLASTLPAAGGADDDRAGAPAAARALARARRRHIVDRLAALAVRAGGVGIVASILAILIFIVAEVLPMLSAATVSVQRMMPVGGGVIGAVVGDAYGT